jgi:hypothetical protein
MNPLFRDRDIALSLHLRQLNPNGTDKATSLSVCDIIYLLYFSIKLFYRIVKLWEI